MVYKFVHLTCVTSRQNRDCVWINVVKCLNDFWCRLQSKVAISRSIDPLPPSSASPLKSTNRLCVTSLMSVLLPPSSSGVTYMYVVSVAKRALSSLLTSTATSTACLNQKVVIVATFTYVCVILILDTGVEEL